MPKKQKNKRRWINICLKEEERASSSQLASASSARGCEVEVAA
jgi:hypothetical protein